MVGFKSIWLLLTLLLFAACVPQTKQTACGSNEAFNATLRTCVPVVNGPSSFINISAFLPTSSLTKYKNDTTPITLEIFISNPYAQTYTIEWERLYNGVPVAITPSTPTTYAFAPSFLATEVGTHIITVKIKDNSSVIVDSHSFEVKINDNPKPVIQSATVTPALYATNYNPGNLPQNFSFTTFNNSGQVSGAGYRTDWKMYRNGVLKQSESDAFTNTGILDLNYPSYTFNPVLVDGITLGAYVINARVTNALGEVVAEQQWTTNVSHPALSKITARNIYSGSASPTFTTVSTAYDAVPYTDYSFNSLDKNFIPALQLTQGNYCVTVADPEGTYASDGLFVRVDFYLDGATQVYSTTTSNAVNGNRVCLSDGGAGTLAGVVFNNSTPTATQAHTLVARVVDEATGQEYVLSDMNASLGSYPITWNFSVKPSNAAPTVAFTANANLANITCPLAGVGVNRACNVTQGSTFTLGVSATDDFYSTSSTTDATQAHFAYTMTLYRGSTVVSTCTKTFANVNPDTNLPGTDYVGPDYLCNFTVPTYDANGSIHPTADAWSVSVVFSDDGSPVIGASAATAPTYNYLLTVAEYSNPVGPAIAAQGLTVGTDSYITVNWVTPGAHTSVPNSTTPVGNAASVAFVTEGDTIDFNVRVSDPEMDDYSVEVYHCFDSTVACLVPVSIVPLTSVTKSDNAATKLTTYNYLLPESLIPITSALNTNVDVFFKVRVADAPDTLVGVIVESIFSTNVQNKNPPPVVNTALQVPALVGPHSVAVGYPFTIDPGTVSDASLVAAENSLAYQWYVSPDNVTFSAIGGATSRVLTWTPSLVYGATAYLRMCATDGTAVYPLSGNFVATCTGTRASSAFQIDIKTNLTTADITSVSGVSAPSTGAVWYDTTAGNTNVAYMASVEFDAAIPDYYINVSKLVRETGGAWNNTFKNVRFKALQSVQGYMPSDLSISGTANSLYIAYKCAPFSAPSSAKACIRRIEKGYVAAGNEKTNLIHLGKFGFSYTAISIVETDANITYTAPTVGNDYQVDFSAGVPVAGSVITVNGVAFTADGNLNGIVEADEFCAASVPGCTTATAASVFKDLINQSTNANLQGFTAQLAGTSVNISGMKALDSWDSLITVLGVGKISVDNTGFYWHLPVINSSLPGATLNRVSVLSSAVDAHLSAAVTQTEQASIDRAASIASDIDDANNLVIALISTEPLTIGQGKIYSITYNAGAYSGAVATTTSLFAGEGLSSIRLAASRGANAFNYVAAYGNTTTKWKLGRYAEGTLGLSNIAEQDIEDMTPNSGTGADDVVVSADVEDIQIVTDPAINGEARLAVTNFGAIVTEGFYLLRWTVANVLSCPEDSVTGECTPFSTFITDAASRVYVSFPQTAVTTGVAGATAGENITTVVHAMVFPAASVPATPHHLVMNIVPESIQGNETSLHNGTSGWRPPYVK